MSNFDTVFEEKIIQTIFVDHEYGKQIMEVIEPKLFDATHTRKFAEILVEYYGKYEAFPSISLVPSLLEENREDELTVDKCKNFISKVQKRPLNGDIDYVKDKSLEFFRLQNLISVFEQEVFPRIDKGTGRLEEIVPIIEKAINRGTDNDIGYDYMSDEEERFKEENILTIPTYWEAINEKLRGGGFGQKRVITFLAPPGAGKCFAKGTKVLMFDGSTKKVEDVNLGDLLMGPDSKPREVLSLAQGREEMFRVNPAKGSSWICNRSHILSLVHSVENKTYNLSIDDYISLPKSKKKNLKQYRSNCIEFPRSDQEVPSYFAGLWLGDGTKGRVEVTTADGVMVEYLRNYAEKNEYNFREYQKKGQENLAASYRLTKDRSTAAKGGNLLLNELKSFVVNDEKRIPKKYLIADKAQRFDLLAGLIDSDGHLSNNGYEIITKYSGLCDDILFLCRSLGLAAYSSIKHNREYDRDYFRIFVSGDCSQIPVRLERKRADARTQTKSVLRTGISVESIGEGEYFGFSVDCDHLFLLEDFTVVHNSSLLVNVGASALEQGKVVAHYTLELDWREIAEKYDACLSGVEINNLSGYKSQVLHAIKKKIPEGGRLIIKEYPMKGASVQTIKNHLAKLKLKDIIPDIIIIDQGGLLKSSSKDKENRHNLSANWIDMKGLAQVQKVPVVTAHQINRSGYNEEVINLDQIAECFDIIGHSDAVITLARNIQQKQAGMGKILLGKNRQGIDGVIMAYAINGHKAAIEIFDMTPEIEERIERMKKDAEIEENISIADRMRKFLGEKKESE